MSTRPAAAAGRLPRTPPRQRCDECPSRSRVACSLSLRVTGAVGDTTPTDPRSQRNRAGRRGGQLLTRALIPLSGRRRGFPGAPISDSFVSTAQNGRRERPLLAVAQPPPRSPFRAVVQSGHALGICSGPPRRAAPGAPFRSAAPLPPAASPREHARSHTSAPRPARSAPAAPVPAAPPAAHHP
jgi:hypothetical protein